MAEIGFYHLTVRTLEDALPQLLHKALERGWHSVVEVGDRQRLRALDDHLWTFSDSAFLPHGSALGTDDAPDPHPDRQPVWLTEGNERPNGARARFFVGGSFPAAGFDPAPYDRVAILFDGASEAEVARARDAWKALRGSGHPLTYWKQAEAGTWQRAATEQGKP